jgi:hypothetical protein
MSQLLYIVQLTWTIQVRGQGSFEAIHPTPGTYVFFLGRWDFLLKIQEEDFGIEDMWVNIK